MKSQLAVLFCVLGLGCRGGSGTTTATGVVATLNGVVPGAMVSSGKASTTANADGRFQLDIPASGTSVLTFSKAGFAPAYLAVTPSGAASITVSASLAPIATTATVDVHQAPATVTANELVLTFPQGSIRTRSGTVPDGPVEVAVTWLERKTAAAIGPVPLMGTDGSEVYPLVTLGMFDVSVSFNGEPCDLVPGKTMSFTLPAQSDDPAAASLFWVDPQQALWVQEGPATNQGGQWTGEVPHLSWWNVDFFYKVPKEKCACVTFVARTPSGAGLAGVSVRNSPTAKYPFGGWTEKDGTLCHSCFPTGEAVEVIWGYFLGTTAKNAVSGILTVTPTATGVLCGSPACQEVAILVQCTMDDQCKQGEVCKQGACTPGGGTPPPPKLLGSCDIIADLGMCYQFGGGIDQAVAEDICTNKQAIPGQFKLGVPCPTANALGTCRYNDSDLTYYRPMFEGATDALRSSCIQSGGTWL